MQRSVEVFSSWTTHTGSNTAFKELSLFPNYVLVIQ